MQYNKRCFFKEIFIFVVGVHLISLGMLFVCDIGKFHHERFVLNTNNLQSTVVFIPLKKRVQEQDLVENLGNKSNGARKVMSYQAYEKKLAQQQNKKKKEKKVIASKKIIPKPKPAVPGVKAPVKPVAQTPQKKAAMSLQQEKNKKLEIQKAQQKEQALRAAQQAAEKKAIALKEQAALQAKKVADKLAEEKQMAEKLAVQAAALLAEQQQAEADKKLAALQQQKIAEEKNVAEQQALLEAQRQQAITVPEQTTEVATVSDDDAEIDDEDLQTISFVGSHDLEIMHIKEKIHAEIVKYYKPPVGIAKKAVCELAVVVGMRGKAERVTVKKSSGSLANDMCARAALLHVTFPKEVIGKEIIVELGQ